MISSNTGEVTFSNGWRLLPQEPFSMLSEHVLSSKDLPIPDWHLHEVGVHASEFGDFDVTVVCGPQQRLSLVMLTHRHSFYEPDTKRDGERRVYHENILTKDLRGLRQHAWGEAFCRFDAQDHRDRIVLAYTRGSQIPQQIAEVLLNLDERERFEQSGERSGGVG